jgi:glycopeptide antibiotics resistance protein
MKNRKIVLAVNAAILAALFGLVSFNKEYLRPALSYSPSLRILTGCFPNFIAAFLISSVVISAVLIKKLKRGRTIVYACSIAVSVLLIIEEYKPMWGASEHFDIYDIIASVTGSILAIIIYELLKSKLKMTIRISP